MKMRFFFALLGGAIVIFTMTASSCPQSAPYKLDDTGPPSLKFRIKINNEEVKDAPYGEVAVAEDSKVYLGCVAEDKDGLQEASLKFKSDPAKPCLVYNNYGIANYSYALDNMPDIILPGHIDSEGKATTMIPVVTNLNPIGCSTWHHAVKVTVECSAKNFATYAPASSRSQEVTFSLPAKYKPVEYKPEE